METLRIVLRWFYVFFLVLCLCHSFKSFFVGSVTTEQPANSQQTTSTQQSTITLYERHWNKVYLTLNPCASYSVGDTTECERHCNSDDMCGGVNVFYSANPGRFVCELMGEVPDDFMERMTTNQHSLGFLRKCIGFQKIDVGGFYYVTTLASSRDAAIAYCKSRHADADLLDITSPEREQIMQDITNASAYTGDFVVTSGRRSVPGTDQFTWTNTGKAITGYTNWYPGEPNNQPAPAHCLYLRPVTYNWHWADYKCAQQSFVICAVFM